MLRPEATALFILLAFFDTRNVVGHAEVTMRAMREALGAVVKAFSAARAVMHPVHRSNRSGGFHTVFAVLRSSWHTVQ